MTGSRGRNCFPQEGSQALLEQLVGKGRRRGRVESWGRDGTAVG